MTTIIMTDCTAWNGVKYISFYVKGGRMVGEIDHIDGKHKVFYGEGVRAQVIGVRSDKDSAIRQLQNAIRAGIQGDVKFNWSVTAERYSLA